MEELDFSYWVKPYMIISNTQSDVELMMWETVFNKYKFSDIRHTGGKSLQRPYLQVIRGAVSVMSSYETPKIKYL